MIDWFSLLFNTFWIVGLAVLLAAFSHAHWLAGYHKQPLRQQLNAPTFSRWFWISMILIAVGLAGTSRSWWETVVWIIFVVVGLVNVARIKQS